MVRSYYYEHIDPNDPPSERDQFVQARVQALVSTPREQHWITDQTTDVGGTYHRRLIATLPMFTTIHAEIGPGKPTPSPTTGLQMLPTVVAEVDSVLQQVHTITLLPLLAGNDYYCTLRINDQQGEWFTLVEGLTTLRRTVSVDYNSVFINNDGDGGGTGEGEFWVTAFQGKDQIDQLNFGDDEFAILTGTSIPVSRQIVRGPEAVSADNHDISINAAGIEYDGWFESDEHANTWGHPPSLRRNLDFPAGTGETLTNRYFQVQAIPGSVDATFAFTVQGNYSVTYS